jgi:hypothetical protein
MIGWGRGNRRGCCVVVPVGCLMTGVPVLLFSGLAVARRLAR